MIFFLYRSLSLSLALSPNDISKNYSYKNKFKLATHLNHEKS